MKSDHRLLQMILATAIVAGPLAALILADPPRKTDARQSDRVEAARTTTDQKKENTPERSSSKNDRKSISTSLDKPVAPLSREREETAIRFAREHHPELAELLEGLRKSDRQNYQAGLQDLVRDAERLGKMIERDQERYVASLDSWKLDSRIRLEIARLSMSPGEDFEPRLRPLMEERQAVRKLLLELDRKRLTERLARTNEQLSTLEDSPEGLITAEIDRLRKLVSSRARTKGARPQTSEGTASADQRKSAELKTSRPKNLPTTSAD